MKVAKACAEEVPVCACCHFLVDKDVGISFREKFLSLLYRTREQTLTAETRHMTLKFHQTGNFPKSSTANSSSETEYMFEYM